MGKREDYISWDDYFMGIAMLAAKKQGSKYSSWSVYSKW